MRKVLIVLCALGFMLGGAAPALADYATYETFPGLVVGYANLTPDRLRAAVAEFAQVAALFPVP
ncbi:hypothetical protein ACFQ1S_25940 [Kibdelosporangium lantanae]|uniref:Uncharacterized protein n=1 Tax=Kibdelosporangium lantanae TaxID=1497396 RepID=A0ABW3MGF5_9PSEU